MDQMASPAPTVPEAPLAFFLLSATGGGVENCFIRLATAINVRGHRVERVFAKFAVNYLVATRIAAAAATPLVGCILATVPRLFRAGERGTAATAGLARRLLPPILLYGIATAAGLIFCAPLLPMILGTDFDPVLDLVPWLAPLPLLAGISQLGLNVLTALGRQRTRVGIEATALVANVVLNVVLIPPLGATGAALAALGSQSLLGALPTVAVWRMTREVAPPEGGSDG